MDLIEPPIGKTFAEGISNTNKNFWTIVINNLLCQLTSLLAGITLIGLLIVPAIYGGYLESLIRANRGEQIKIGDFYKRGFAKFFSLLGASILILLFIALGLGLTFLSVVFIPGIFSFLALIVILVPILYYIICWYFLVYVIVDKETDCGAFEAFEKSKNLINYVSGWWHSSIFIGLLGIVYILIEVIFFLFEFNNVSVFLILGARLLFSLFIYPFLFMIPVAFYNASVVPAVENNMNVEIDSSKTVNEVQESEENNNEGAYKNPFKR